MGGTDGAYLASIATKLLVRRKRLDMVSHSIRSIGESAAIATVVELGSNDLVGERVALKLLKEDFNFLLLSFLLSSIGKNLEDICQLRSKDANGKVRSDL